MGVEELLFRPAWPNRINQRMPDELGIDARLTIHVFFKWKDDKHLVHQLADLLDATRAPRPHLWTDVINDRRTGLPDSLGEPQIEIRKIDEYCGRRRIFRHT